MHRRTIALIALPMLLLSGLGLANPGGGTADIKNLRSYSSSFYSSGQPSATQLKALKDDGFERIIYIAFSDHEHSLAKEDRLVKSLGMDYLHIPVIWDKPAANDFMLFASAMQQAPDAKTLLHCQVNYRASAFALLYRVIYLNVPLKQAMADMHSVWTPTEPWIAFMQNQLQAHDKPITCQDCNWNPKPQDK